MSREPATDLLLPTRQSLPGRLRDLHDQVAWREFFDACFKAEVERLHRETQ